MMTLDMISTSITNSITKASETTDEEKEVIEYGVNIALSEITKLSAVLLLSIPFGTLKYTLFIIIVLGILRSFLGGVHAHTHIGCFLSYSSIIFSVIFLSKFCSPLFCEVVMLVTLPFVYIAIIKYAPADIENKPVVSVKRRKYLRRTSIIIISILYPISLVLPQIYSNMLIFTVVTEALTMLPITYKITKNKYGVERGS